MAKVELPTVGETCETCRFWVVTEEDYSESHFDDGTLGECRRYPPTVVGTPSFRELDDVTESTCHPAICYDHWCGEWRGRAAAQDHGRQEPPTLKLEPTEEEKERSAVLELLRQAGDDGATPWRIFRSLYPNRGGADGRIKSLLKRLAEEGVVERVGKGHSTDPFRYRLRAATP
jgi:hypothetical protein